MNSRIRNLEEYHTAYQESVENPEKFWANIAEEFSWRKPWNKVLSWNFDAFDVKWFEGGQLNLTENCLDRHLAERGNQVAILWEPNEPTQPSKKITYNQLHEEVCKAANMLKKLGAEKGDRICIYMPMVPEAAITMLACARIGAVHSIVFAGFSAQSLADRINDSLCKFVITADGAHRGAKDISLKEIVDEALLQTSCVKNVVVFRHT